MTATKDDIKERFLYFMKHQPLADDNASYLQNIVTDIDKTLNKQSSDAATLLLIKAGALVFLVSAKDNIVVNKNLFKKTIISLTKLKQKVDADMLTLNKVLMDFDIDNSFSAGFFKHFFAEPEDTTTVDRFSEKGNVRQKIFHALSLPLDGLKFFRNTQGIKKKPFEKNVIDNSRDKVRAFVVQQYRSIIGRKITLPCDKKQAIKSFILDHSTEDRKSALFRIRLVWFFLVVLLIFQLYQLSQYTHLSLEVYLFITSIILNGLFVLNQSKQYQLISIGEFGLSDIFKLNFLVCRHQFLKE